MDQRLSALRQKMAARRLDALLITQPENLRYISGFAGEEATLFITATAAYILTDFRYVGMAQEQCPNFTLVETTVELPLDKAVLGLVRDTGVSRLGFEAHHLTYETYRNLRKALLAERHAVGACRGDPSRPLLVPVARLVEEIRAIKTPEELAIIERAVRLGDAAFNHVFQMLTAPNAPVMTERQVAWELERYIRENGGDGVSFEVAVAAGPNSAIPHHRSSQRPIQPGEPAWIDVGARLDGYCSDLTRTFCLGQPDDRYKEIYSIVLNAQLAAEGALRPGITGKEVDAVARRVITAAGYGDAFRHGTGHGVGLAVHELPSLSQRAGRDRLVPGHVVTVEPGIYLPGWGGIRIEDMAVVTTDGCRILTTAPK